jgi:transmembrane sensor
VKTRPSPKPATAHSAAAGAGNRLDPLDWIGEAEAGTDILRAIERQKQQRRRHRSHAALAACGVLVLTGALWVLNTPSRHTLGPPASMQVQAPLRQVLPDGTIVELRDSATIAVDYQSSVRRVTLRQGEAHFIVVKSDRPFVVVVQEIEVRAVGTAFSVQLRARDVDVLVTEGRVAVETATVAAGGETPVILTGAMSPKRMIATVDAGNRIAVDLKTGDATRPPQPLAATELQERLAWRVPRLEFSGTPLAEALPMFSEHSRLRLTLADSSLAKLKLSGVVRADNVETLLELLAEEHGIDAQRRSADEIVLSRKRP